MRCQCLSILDTAISEMDAYLDQRSEAFAEVMESTAEIVAELRDIGSKYQVMGCLILNVMPSKIEFVCHPG